MACTTCFHSTALSRTLRPFLPRRTPLSYSNLRRLHRFISTGLFTSSFNPSKSLVQPVFAQARRGFSSMAKEEAVASPADLQFDGPLKIVEYPDPILRAKNKRVNMFNESLKKLVDEMFDVMYRTDGIGLSAPQVGINVQLMVFNPAGERGEGEEIVLINPHVNRYSKKIVPFNEGCLSFPGIYADVERPDSLKVDAQDITGARFEVNLSGLPARVFQHEYDHLQIETRNLDFNQHFLFYIFAQHYNLCNETQGILFFDRMSDDVLDSIRSDLQALEKKYEIRTGLSSPERIDARRRRKKAVGFGKSQ